MHTEDQEHPYTGIHDNNSYLCFWLLHNLFAQALALFFYSTIHEFNFALYYANTALHMSTGVM